MIALVVLAAGITNQFYRIQVGEQDCGLIVRSAHSRRRL